MEHGGADESEDHGASPKRLTFMQRQALKGLAKQAHKRPDEPLCPDDWEAYWRLASQRVRRTRSPASTARRPCHAQAHPSVLERAGYGSSGEPDFAIGIGLDFGEAFIGNIGDTAVHDFTAVGDVVNTAARLQSHAAGGEVLLSARLARLFPEPVGVPDSLVLKGKQDPVDVRRVRWFPASA